MVKAAGLLAVRKSIISIAREADKAALAMENILQGNIVCRTAA
jgi:hypothetical protein